jgi:hypothetical protein
MTDPTCIMQVLQNKTPSRAARSTDAHAEAEDTSFQLVMGRRVKGFPVPMPRASDAVVDVDYDEELIASRPLPRPIIAQDQKNAEPQQDEAPVGFVGALKIDAKSLLEQSKSMMWFLPSWAWSLPAMITYFALTAGVVWQIVIRSHVND